ncbi:RNA-directed DNA polymerase, eukaryota [Tanacetum coccineum]
MLLINNIQASEIAQKAKIKWAIEGDENVKFFHGMLNKKRNQSNIQGIMVNGTWVDDPVQVKHEFFEHFRGRFDKPSVNRACIDTPFPVSLSIDQKEDMERRISKEEVKRAVWDCGVDKSPGPDGFSFSFYRHFWLVIEKDVFEAVDYFFMYGEIPNGCNSNFIALIPKILDANMVKDFRPISLIGSLYKIIAKILANRLVGVLGDLVNEVQSAFVADRQILDGPFILDEVLQWCRRKKKHALIFKVDFEKAFDSVRWDFVDDVLNKFGFGERWRTWIQSCLRSSRGSILVNGSPTEEFQFFRGLKQGDPLSPFLFILIMESLHISFQRVVDAGLFTGIKINSMVNLSHLFYADDAIFLGQWSELNIDSLVRVLDCFFRASGLRINMCKSKIMGVNVEDGMVKNAASKLGCLVLKTPFTYLGMKVGGNMSRKQAWKGGGQVGVSLIGQDPKSNKASWRKVNKVLTERLKGFRRYQACLPLIEVAFGFLRDGNYSIVEYLFDLPFHSRYEDGGEAVADIMEERMRLSDYIRHKEAPIAASLITYAINRDVIAEIGFSSGDSELHVSVLCVVAAVTTLCATTSIRSCGGLPARTSMSVLVASSISPACCFKLPC